MMPSVPPARSYCKIHRGSIEFASKYLDWLQAKKDRSLSSTLCIHPFRVRRTSFDTRNNRRCYYMSLHPPCTLPAPPPLPPLLFAVSRSKTRDEEKRRKKKKKISLIFFEKLLHAIDNFNVLWLYYKIRWTKNRTCVTSFEIYLRSAALLRARIYK